MNHSYWTEEYHTIVVAFLLHYELLFFASQNRSLQRNRDPNFKKDKYAFAESILVFNELSANWLYDENHSLLDLIINILESIHPFKLWI